MKLAVRRQHSSRGRSNATRQGTPRLPATRNAVRRKISHHAGARRATSRTNRRTCARDESRPAAASVAQQDSQQSNPDDAPTGPDMSRQAEAMEAESSRYIVRPRRGSGIFARANHDQGCAFGIQPSLDNPRVHSGVTISSLAATSIVIVLAPSLPESGCAGTGSLALRAIVSRLPALPNDTDQ